MRGPRVRVIRETINIDQWWGDKKKLGGGNYDI